ncbi:flagellar hook-associated protein 3 [Cupriavidus sp. USMAA2-4]|uniref:Flagellar hook-associated protein 3 n=1 Tax=Cupriavidus malaysiensis TaxID=367825 RepID=A0ABN4TRI5_9BURK|nr:MULTISPECIES: flagellar hook-associated protein FlgL [Cupriavidus]AOY95744.1 flagellar hook-associated protein 3 [Cupriavidus sp. USMAA2-4]AOZ03740.1 flagellar hook-associated protein 3 [Cupriavidus sp. USMAHM13]AOZ08891.1 flagellar hook-associated protein 3 [Cupriavidus malaysiensis]
MRVATSMLYQQGLASIQGQQSSLMQVQQQLGTGKRIVTPSDDPVGATRALGVSQSIAVNDQYTATRTQATNMLGLESNALQSVVTTVQNIQGLLVQAGNGTLNDSDRASLATSLQAQYNQLLGLANSDNGNGQYLFAGYQSGSAPFTQGAGGGIQYNGDTGQQLLQVDVSRQMAAGDSGSSLFMSVQPSAGYVVQAGATNTGTGVFSALAVTNPSDPLYGHSMLINFQNNATTGALEYTVTDETVQPPAAVGSPVGYTPGSAIQVGGVSFTLSGTPAAGDTLTLAPAQQSGTNVFSSLSQIIQALKTPVGSAADQANLSNALSTGSTKITNALDNVLTVQTSVGSRIQELTTLNDVGTNRNLNYTTTLSSLEDLDYASAISQYYQYQTALQAAQQSFVKIQGMNLFKYVQG